jgi:hypothetical protein
MLDAACPGPLFLIREHLDNNNIPCVLESRRRRRKARRKIRRVEAGLFEAFMSRLKPRLGGQARPTNRDTHGG